MSYRIVTLRSVFRVTLLLSLPFVGVEQAGCSGTPSTGGSGTGGAGSGTGGHAATGGSAASGGAGGVCGSNCQVESTTGPFCGTFPLSLVCHGPFPVDLHSIMSANGCVDAGTGAVRYCCPSQILTQCQ
jgi:hypothetical protein